MGCSASTQADFVHTGPLPDVIPPLWSSVAPSNFRVGLHKKEYCSKKLRILLMGSSGESDFLSMQCSRGRHVLSDVHTGAKIAFCKRIGQKFCIYKIGSPVFDGQAASAAKLDGAASLYLYATVKPVANSSLGRSEGRIQFVHRKRSTLIMNLFANRPEMKKIVNMGDKDDVWAAWSTKDNCHFVETTCKDSGLLACLVVLNQFLAEDAIADHIPLG